MEKEFGPVNGLDEARRRVEERLKALRAAERELVGVVRDREARFQEAEQAEKRLRAQLAGVEQTLKDSRQKLERVAEYEAKIRALDGVVERYGDVREGPPRKHAAPPRVPDIRVLPPPHRPAALLRL